jgi:hypothetical protein
MTEAFVDLKQMTGLGPSRRGWRNAAPRRDRIKEVMDFYFGAGFGRPTP